ncbi:MAG: DNA mismatch repair endonuclease MutL [Clostridiales bacterium]|nr:DNA mismatch repair endonuclease MutL [Clostridiales bacterium]
MSKINVLKKEISELIAAGEVIDRPASIIKELLENAIDSDANVITIEIKNGGRTYLRITDNGSGINKEDVSTAFLRHATSKIKQKDDLDKILTLGFRGEALASIAAVSKVDVLTKTKNDEFGTHYIIEGSDEKLYEECGCQDGTTIIVRNIFYNVPARLRFLKKDVTEGNAIASIVSKIALSHPEISFKFIRDNRTDLVTAGDGKLYSAIYSVMGRDFANTLIEVNYSSNGISVSGYISKPLLSKSKRSFQNFYINERYIKSITCMVAIEEAYRNSIMTGKFPACVLKLTIPPNLIDVNVHPAKTEVRFSNEKLVYDSIYFAVKNALLKNDATNELDFKKTTQFTNKQLYDIPKGEEGTQEKFDFSTKKFESVGNFANNSPNKNNDKQLFSTNSKDLDKVLQPVLPINGDIENADLSNTINQITNEKSEEIISEIKEISNETDVKLLQLDSVASSCNKDSEDIIENSIIEEIDDNAFKYISSNSFVRKSIEDKVIIQEKKIPKLIGEIFNTYIVVEHDGDMFLIDKHAAHERYIFQKIKSQDTKLSIQMFIEPIIVILSFEEYDAIIDNLDVIKDLGFNIEDDVAPAVSVTGIPSVLEDTNPNDIIPELAENLLNHMTNPQLDLIDELYHSIACRSAVKANDNLHSIELQKLIDLIFEDENIKYCPHGRPVMIKLTKRGIEKQFKRIL